MFEGGLLAGMPAQDKNQMIAMALANFGGGILAGNKPGATFGQAVGQGLLSGTQAMMQYPQMQMQQKLMQQKMMEAENKRKYADAIQKYIAAGGKLDSPEVLSNLAGYDPGAAMDVLSRREERAERREEREDDRSFRMRMFNLEMAGRKDLA